MSSRQIKNFDELATTPNRKLALEIIEAGSNAINTRKVIESSIFLKDNNLIINGEIFDLSKYKRIKVVGFGKSSCEAALALEEVLKEKITGGVVIGLNKVPAKYIETFSGTHPRPSEENLKVGKKIFELINNSTEEDLIIVLVSGGGSSLLCYPESEYVQGVKLYDGFLKAGKTISEMNTVRKHISLFKGGGLAKIAYPATIIGLIFSDVPGTDFKDVASGPTYKDETTIEEVKKIAKENNLDELELNETPKENKYFENVHNFVLVSNKTAVEAMNKKADELGIASKIISTELYDETSVALEKIFNEKKENSIILAAGEPSIIVGKNAGKGGRNLHMALRSIEMGLIDNDSLFISFASDGMDNSDAAGAIADKSTIKKINDLEIDIKDYLNRFDSYNVFEKTNDIIMTGPTGANVSDIMLLLNKK